MKKRFVYITMLGIVCLIMCSCSTLLAQKQQDKAATMLREFYTAYITAVAGDDDIRTMNEKLETLQKKYCTRRLINSIPVIVEETGADAILKAQDSHLGCLDKLTVERLLPNSNNYLIRYVWPNGNDTISINVTVVTVRDEYRLDSIR